MDKKFLNGALDGDKVKFTHFRNARKGRITEITERNPRPVTGTVSA